MHECQALSPDTLREWLEWAGSKLIALPVGRIKPKEAGGYWPEFSQEIFQVLEFRGTLNVRAPPPSSSEIPVMEEVLLLPNVHSDRIIRKILHARLLVHPIRGNYLNSWADIGKILHLDRKTIRYRHEKGLREVCATIPEAQVKHLAGTFAHIL